MWQLAKAYGVTRNEPKIHVICYITPSLLCLKEENTSPNKICVCTTISARAECDTMLTFKPSVTGLNWVFSFSYTGCLTMAKKPSLPYYLAIAGKRKIGSIPFLNFFKLCKKQSVSSRIWTRADVFMSYDNSHYTTAILFYLLLRTGRMWDKVNFLVKFNKFEFRVFLLLDLLPC